MGLLFCYSVFSRRGKVGKAVPDLGSKIGLRGTRKVELECTDLAARDLALLKDMEEYKVVKDALKGNDALKDAVPDYSSKYALMASYAKEQPGSKSDVASHEFIVDVEKLSSHEDSQQQPFVDHSKSCYETPLWSSCSQGTFQVEISLSAGEGTVSSDGHRAVLPQDGGSLCPHEEASSLYSYGDRSNVSSRAHGFHDGDSAACAGLPNEFAHGTQYSDYGVPEVVADPKSEDAAEGEECLDSSHLLNERVCDDEERYSGHASDPGCYVREALKMSPEGACVDGSMSPPLGANEFPSLHFTDAEKHSVEAGDVPAQAHHVSQGVSSDDLESSFSRVKEWVNSIQSPDMDFGLEDEDRNATGRGSLSVESAYVDPSEASVALYPTDLASASSSLANTAVRSLHPSSTVAHLSGIGLREVPSLGIFSSLKSLNLSANLIVHVPVGCLPRSLHSLDLSRNRISQIEGLRELTRLRVLNLSHNRITRIGHGLANCTLIKELYLAGNKIAEVEGLHRLLKLAVLDLSFNKITTSKALGQLAANYGSLLALNLLGNPILTNFSEDQIRKLVTALSPHVAYLNRQPIKAISVREAALDSVARAALGTSLRGNKSRDTKAGRKAPGATISAAKKKPPPHQHSRHSEKKVTSTSSSGHHHHHVKASGKGQGAGQLSILGESQSIAFDLGKRPMPRSRSAGVLQE